MAAAPVEIATSTLPEISVCIVSPPPDVYSASTLMPCLAKILACSPRSGTDVSQVPRCGTATLMRSSAAAVPPNHATRIKRLNARSADVVGFMATLRPVAECSASVHHLGDLGRDQAVDRDARVDIVEADQNIHHGLELFLRHSVEETARDRDG